MLSRKHRAGIFWNGDHVRPHLESDLLITTQKKVNKLVMQISGRKQFSRENNGKTLRWEHACHVQITTRETVWLSK